MPASQLVILKPDMYKATAVIFMNANINKKSFQKAVKPLKMEYQSQNEFYSQWRRYISVGKVHGRPGRVCRMWVIPAT